jgi:phosphatidate cytidylyltransferase
MGPCDITNLLGQFSDAIPALPLLDTPTMILLAVILAVLGITFAVGKYLQAQPDSTINKGFVRILNNRVQAWWMMYLVMGATLLWGSYRWPAVLFFFLISFWALREFITLTPTRLGDHRALFWVFFVFAPLQYLLVWLGHRTYDTIFGVTFDASRLFSNLIPIYAMLFIPARIALAGDHKRFLERSAKITMGLYLCVFALSHAPALLDLKLKAHNNELWTGGNAGVLLFFLLVVQLSDVFQFAFDKLIGSRVIAPGINATKSWEGFAGGTLSATLAGLGLWWVTPFTPLQAASMAAVLSVMGFLGSMAMSAIKRDRGVHDYGTLVEGHVGILDRFDSICFAAPVFFHLTRFFFT